MKIKKIKITLLIFSGLIILSFAFFSVAQENSSSNKNIFQDSDQDGLTNDEENSYGTDPYKADTDGDGYSDGVEIQSGYDPLKSAPGDKIVIQAETQKVAGTSTENNGENLTKELSTKAATLISQSQTENKEISIDDLDGVINQTMGEELTFDNLPETDEKTIIIKEQNYSNLSEEDRKKREKEDAMQYLTKVSYIVSANAPETISKKEDLSRISTSFIGQVKNLSDNFSDLSYFENIAVNGEKALEQLKEIEVPENLLSIHKKGLQMANYAVSLKENGGLDINDPLKLMLTMSKASSFIDLVSDFYSELKNEFEKIGITEIPINL